MVMKELTSRCAWACLLGLWTTVVTMFRWKYHEILIHVPMYSSSICFVGCLEVNHYRNMLLSTFRVHAIDSLPFCRVQLELKSSRRKDHFLNTREDYLPRATSVMIASTSLQLPLYKHGPFSSRFNPTANPFHICRPRKIGMQVSFSIISKPERYIACTRSSSSVRAVPGIRVYSHVLPAIAAPTVLPLDDAVAQQRRLRAIGAPST